MRLPLLYTYRRCPYAMRARMALHYAGIEAEFREIALKQKPAHMLSVSPKGTVPVLILEGGKVIDESLEIMLWALESNDPDNWMINDSSASALITENDNSFKQALDRYKYATRFPEHPSETYRAQGENFLKSLENRLTEHKYLLGDKLTMADIAIFPFVRQFSMVEPAWFAALPYERLQKWLDALTGSELFETIMKKHPTWIENR